MPIVLIALVSLALLAPLQDAPDGRVWANVQALCGSAFEGKVVEAPPADMTFAGKKLTMHVRECTPTVIRIPFHVGEDRSRTWVLTRTATGIRLKHDHRHADGTEDKVSQYGGDSRPGAMANKIEFPADAQTVGIIPEAKTNVWTIELEPGRTFVYALRREGTDRRFRIEFDLGRKVPAPPAPWGAALSVPEVTEGTEFFTTEVRRNGATNGEDNSPLVLAALRRSCSGPGTSPCRRCGAANRETQTTRNVFAASACSAVSP